MQIRLFLHQLHVRANAFCLQALADDPGDNTDSHTPFHIQTDNGKRYIVLFLSKGWYTVICRTADMVEQEGRENFSCPVGKRKDK